MYVNAAPLAEQQNDCPYGCAGGAQPTSKDFN